MHVCMHLSIYLSIYQIGMHIKLAVDDDGKEVRMSFPHTNEMDLHDYACMFVQAVGRETDNLPVL